MLETLTGCMADTLERKKNVTWFMYVVECADATLYTGVATDVERRVEEHNGSKRGAKYTKTRRPVCLLGCWAFESRSDACSAEHAFKKFSRDEKLARLAK